jgi:hypothetical protein
MLEAELRTEGHAQVVVRTVLEENVIACFQTDSDRASECLDSSRGIKREGSGAGGKTHSVCETGRSILVSNAEVIKSDLAGDKHAKWSGAVLLVFEI